MVPNVNHDPVSHVHIQRLIYTRKVKEVRISKFLS